MTTAHPFRFGIAAGSVTSGRAWAEQARKAEALGYSTLLVPDHYVNEIPPLTPLMAAAAATTTLRVGTIVCNNDFRHPALLAKEAAALDLLSDGRLELGLGAGWHRHEYEQIGLAFDAPAVRIARLAEGVTIIKRCFTEEVVTFHGKYYTVTDLPSAPRPVQQPHPPILIGGGGKMVMQLAAREANIIGIHTRVNADESTDFAQQTAAGLDQKLAWIQEAAGERLPQLELNVTVRAAVTDNPLAEATNFAAFRGWSGIAPEQVLETLNVLYGSVDDIVARLQRWRATYGISYYAVLGDDALLEAFAPVVSRLAGT